MNRQKMIEDLLYLDDPVADQAIDYIRLLEKTVFKLTLDLRAEEKKCDDYKKQRMCRINFVEASDYHEGSEIRLCQGLKSKVRSVWNIDGDIWLLLENGIGVKCCK